MVPLILPDGREVIFYTPSNTNSLKIRGNVGGAKEFTEFLAPGELGYIPALLLAHSELPDAVIVKHLVVAENISGGTFSNGLSITVGTDTNGAYLNLPRVKAGGNSEISGDLTVTGNLNVTGQVNSTSTEELYVEDTWIHLNAGLPSTASPTSDAGIIVERGAEVDVKIFWNESDDKWQVVVDESGSAATYDLIHSGNLSNYLPTQTFLGLVDTPSSYSGAAGYYVVVDPLESELVFVSPAEKERYVRADSSDPTSGYLIDKVDDVTLKVNTSTHKMYLASFGSLTTDDLAEGTTHLYFTVGRARNALDQLVMDKTVEYVVEVLSSSIAAEASHTVPGGYEVNDTVKQTPNMILLINGIVYTPDYYDADNGVWVNYDFRASDGIKIIPHFDIPAGAMITYIKFWKYRVS